MTDKQTKPQWQPIEKLPLIAKHIEKMLVFTEENHSAIQKAHAQPYSVDDATVNRIVKVFINQQNTLGLFDEQLVRWKAEKKITPKQREELEYLSEKMERINHRTLVILVLAEEIKTIEDLFEKDDFQAGLEALLGKDLTKEKKLSN